LTKGEVSLKAIRFSIIVLLVYLFVFNRGEKREGERTNQGKGNTGREREEGGRESEKDNYRHITGTLFLFVRTEHTLFSQPQTQIHFSFLLTGHRWMNTHSQSAEKKKKKKKSSGSTPSENENVEKKRYSTPSIRTKTKKKQQQQRQPRKKRKRKRKLCEPIHSPSLFPFSCLFSSPLMEFRAAGEGKDQGGETEQEQ
jgi:hypothetical protein